MVVWRHGAEAGAGEGSDAAWRGFVRRFIATFGGALVAVLAFIVLVDPYDSGRFPSLPLDGISDSTQRTENVSLGRSAKFDAAIFGNSHGQLLDPERLSQATGLSVVQLSVPGANPPEQIALLHWFIRHHARIGGLVITVDSRWCLPDPQPWRWFPFWLYGDSDLAYLANALNTRSLDAAARRIKHRFGLIRPSNPRGYDDYEIGVPPTHHFASAPPVQPPSPAAVAAARSRLASRPFPAIDRLAAEIAAVPADTPIVILFPPQHASTLPASADAAAALDQCKARFARLVAGSPRRGFLDFLVDSAITRASENFLDEEHYRAPVAREIERAIVAVLAGRPS
jgi:hypothetical protein